MVTTLIILKLSLMSLYCSLDLIKKFWRSYFSPFNTGTLLRIGRVAITFGAMAGGPKRSPNTFWGRSVAAVMRKSAAIDSCPRRVHSVQPDL